MENFAVKSESFALYEAFKKDVEKIGYSYNAVFGWGSEDVKDSFCRKRMNNNNCLYFSDKWNSVAFPLSFAFSNSGDAKSFHLESQYGEALAFAKKVWDNENRLYFSTSSTYGLSTNVPYSHLVCPYNPAFYDTTHPDLVFGTPNRDMIDAFLMGGLSGINPIVKPASKFKVGEWVRANDNWIFEVKGIDWDNFMCDYYYESKQTGYKQSNLESYRPKKGEYYWAESKIENTFIGISDGRTGTTSKLASFMVNTNEIYPRAGLDIGDNGIVSIRPATPSEIALLDSKLSERGKRFDKEKCELVDIYKPKFAKGDIVKEIYDGKIGIVTIPAIDHRVCNVVKLSDREDGFWNDNQLIKIGNSL